jgi:hypothetical protein
LSRKMQPQPCVGQGEHRISNTGHVINSSNSEYEFAHLCRKKPAYSDFDVFQKSTGDLGLSKSARVLVGIRWSEFEAYRLYYLRASMIGLPH